MGHVRLKLTTFGVEHFVDLIERKRRLREKVEVIAVTEFLSFLEQVVDLVHDKVHPK